jgi:hypothetical protein
MSSAAGSNGVTSGLVLDLDGANIGLTATVDVLLVAGGGGGGTNMGGGGGAGGVLFTTSSIAHGNTYAVVVGGGGAGAPAGTTGGHPTVAGSNGSNSTFNGLTAVGGGRGGISYNSMGYGTHTGASGGSGGGATGYNNDGSALGAVTGGAGTSGQGNRGGNQGNAYYSGGGGGAGGAGSDGNNTANGGPGICYPTMSPYYFGGGGGAAAYSLATGGNGGIGGGGGGAIGQNGVVGGIGGLSGSSALNAGVNGTQGPNNAWGNVPGGNGGANTGGGGGGGSHYNANNKGGEGGSGIVIIRYLGRQRAMGGVVSSLNGYTIHTFLANGTFDTTTWVDKSGNGNTGTLLNGPVYSSANGGVVVFDGTNDYINIGVNYSSQNNISRTWEAFVKPNATTSTAGIIGTALSGGCSYYCNGGICIWNGNYAFNWYDNSSYQFLDSGIAATSGTFAHVVGTWDGTDSKARIYINGVLRSTSGASNLNYGAYAYAIQIAFLSASANYLNGSIGNMKHYYNKVMSANEVQQSFNASRARYGI